MTTKQKQKPYMENENYPWILEIQKRTSRMGSLDVSITIYINIWQEIAEGQRKRIIIRSSISTNKQDTLLRTTKQNKR